MQPISFLWEHLQHLATRIEVSRVKSPAIASHRKVVHFQKQITEAGGGMMMKGPGKGKKGPSLNLNGFLMVLLRLENVVGFQTVMLF